MRKTKVLFYILILTGICIFASSAFGQVAEHPSQLKYKPLKYAPPKPEKYREVLSSGMVVYMREDHTLPTLDISATIRTGSLYDPKDKIGLASMTGSVMRTGGTGRLSGDDLDERLAYLGASINSYIGTTSGGASLSALIKDAEEGLQLFADVLMNPAFSEDKIQLYKDQEIESIKNKNDSPRSVLSREFNRLFYDKHPLTAEETQASVESITQKDLIAFYAQYYAPNNVILAVAGDFDKESMLKKIEKAFAEWPKKQIQFTDIPKVKIKNRPGVYMVQKEINQGYLNVGHFGIKDTNPDIYAINIMNFILGGGSFTSRIVTKVRSDEGLAYSTGSRFANRHLFPGLFYGYVQTKSATVHYAVSLILDEFKRIRKELVSDDEMETAKNYYSDSFPNRFDTAIRTMRTFASLEYDGFPMDYYDTYREKLNAVTKKDVMRVAKKYIKPTKMSLFVVGDIEKCKAGYDKHPGTLDEFGKIKIIELKDPLTGK
ncbi:M16 family metallopeptidase [bacterium]